ncbi:MAG TPA: hypothetical protein VM695_11550 [Phycisphaerae bacterium]|nr:hypothetical protein [Phycisphaerae bacterium]
MSGKKYLIILGILAAMSFGVSLGVSLLLGGPGPEGKAPAAPPNPSDALLAGLSADPAPREALLAQHKLDELIKDLRARMAEYERKEKALAERARQVATAEQTLRRRAQELETLRTELVGPLTRLKDAVAELRRSRVLIDKQEKAAIRTIASKYERMDPIQGGEILVTMCGNQQTDDVVKILYYMSERVSAKFLAEMPDKALAARLTALMKTIQEQG